jgi:hypothetical protein
MMRSQKEMKMMTTETAEPEAIIPPPGIRSLPIDPKTKLPVPFFVAWIDGKPDFRVVEPGKIVACVREHRCWICGKPLLSVVSFMIGPMCLINRISSEPPSHTSCCRFAARVCPFLSRPVMRRNKKNLPENRTDAAGIGIDRNPGVSVVWTTNAYQPVQVDGGGILFSIADPLTLEFWREGRLATKAEVMESINSGLPILEGIAKGDGKGAIQHLRREYAKAVELIDDFYSNATPFDEGGHDA